MLKGLSLEVCPGQVVALVGPSGGGKSSIVKLVERFYLPQSGMVLLDGRDVGMYDAKWLRRQVALVSQGNLPKLSYHCANRKPQAHTRQAVIT